MPKASGMKFHYLHHDTVEQSLVPPVLNQWYTILDAYDVRLLQVRVQQTNTEAAAKDLEVRWTIDGVVYFCTFTPASGTNVHVYRTIAPSAGGTNGLWNSATGYLAHYYTDLRGQHVKIEFRITAALGTNQTLLGRVNYETLELT